MNKFELFKNINNDIKKEINLFITLYNHKVVKNYKLNKYNKILNNNINYKNNSIKIEAIDAKLENRIYYLFYINENKIGIFILDNDVDYIIISIFGPIYDLFKPDILLEYMLEYIKKHFNDKKIIYRDLTYFLKKNISSSKIYTLLYGYPWLSLHNFIPINIQKKDNKIIIMESNESFIDYNKSIVNNLQINKELFYSFINENYEIDIYDFKNEYKSVLEIINMLIKINIDKLELFINNCYYYLKLYDYTHDFFIYNF